MSDSITFKYTLTEDDFVKTRRISARSFPMYWIHWIIIVCISAMAGYALFLFASGTVPIHWSFKMFPGLVVVLWLVHWWDYSVLPKRMARKMPAALIEQEVNFSDEGVSTQSALGNSNAGWTAYTKARESSDYFLLYASKYLFFPFPKRFFTDSRDIERLRELIRAHISDFVARERG